MAQITLEEKFFPAHDGVRLFYRNWTVPAEKGRVYLVHGFAEHSGRYQRLAEDLGQQGYSLFTYDLRGHGQSGGRRAHVDSFEDYLEDTATLFSRFPPEERRCWLLGHSLGGLIAVRFVQERQPNIAGLVLSSPFLGLAMKVPAVKALAGKMLSSLLPSFSMDTGLDPSILSHDERVVKAYRDDPLVSHVASARWFTETLQAQQLAEELAGKIKLPLLVLQAGDDRLSSVNATRRFFTRVTSENKKLLVYEGFYHEVLNEVERQKPIADLLAFMESCEA